MRSQAFLARHSDDGIIVSVGSYVSQFGTSAY